jgi:hypothetical protein
MPVSTLDNNILPPAPPSAEEEAKTFIPGRFEYIKDKHTKEMLVNAWQAITLTENWKFVAKDIDSFQMSNAPEIWIISNKMEELGYQCHSGFSFGWTMRQMQFISKKGEEEYKQLYN